MSEIRKCFTSRFEHGVLLELDYSQLEIYALAHITGDEQLRSDLLLGADLHSISATNLFGAGFSTKQRKIAKRLSFQLQYGAGYASMAASNGIPEKVAKDFIKQYYKRYPYVKIWQDARIAQAMADRERSDRRTSTGLPAGMYTMKSATGREYTFTEEDSPEWIKYSDTGFSPTKLKNYPIQGFATGDIMPMVLGLLFRKLMGWPFPLPVKMVNTVHDSVVFDCYNEITARRWAVEAKRIMESAPAELKTNFGIDLKLPLPVEASMGESWYTMEVLDI